MGKPRWCSRNLNRDASLVTPSLWAVGQTLIALDRRGLRIPRSFHSKWIAQRGRHGRRLQGEFREQCSGIKRAVGRILMCVKESEQCKDAIGYAAERRLRAPRSVRIVSLTDRGKTCQRSGRLGHHPEAHESEVSHAQL